MNDLGLLLLKPKAFGKYDQIKCKPLNTSEILKHLDICSSYAHGLMCL